MNVFYNFVKDCYKVQEPAWEIPSLCSVIKTFVSWNFAKVAAVCRERCGGMGFLSNARFAEWLACAHTSLTAEGDNRVLMHKIVKDLTKAVVKDGFKMPQPKLNVKAQIGTMDDVSALEYLSDLMKYRQMRLCEDLIAKETALRKQGVSAYDVGMMHTSLLIQDLAQAYGESRMLDSCIDWVSKISPAHDKKVMSGVFRVSAIDAIKKDLAWYVKEKAIKPAAAANLIVAQNSLIKDMSSNIADLLKLLNVPDHVLQTPLAENYVEYFSKPNFGEVVAARL